MNKYSVLLYYDGDIMDVIGIYTEHSKAMNFMMQLVKENEVYFGNPIQDVSNISHLVAKGSAYRIEFLEGCAYQVNTFEQDSI